ncbi:MAG: acyltransferase [Brooklawnia sp.]|nr:acyltransferase [Brooklawnia sp.]
MDKMPPGWGAVLANRPANLWTRYLLADTKSAATGGAGRQYLYGVQGLRTVAAFLVAVYHIWFHRVSGGVDIFFVVAGFFATGSVLRIMGRPGWRTRLADLGQYWLRTLRRVVPSAVVVIAGTVVASVVFLPRSQWLSAGQHGLASLTMRENWHLIEVGSDYLQQGVAVSPFQQFWALSIQVQLYAIFPVILAAGVALAEAVKLRPRPVLAVILTGTFAASLAFSVWLTQTDQPVAYFHLGTRIWEFAAGALLALAASRLVAPPGVLKMAGWTGLLTIVGFAAVLDPSRLLPGALSLVPVVAGAAIIAAARARAEPGLLRSRFALWFADSSFAFYLWHWPVLVLYRWRFSESVSFTGGLAILLVSAGLAVATTKLVEQLIRQSPLLKRSAVATIVASALMVGACGGILHGWLAEERKSAQTAWRTVEMVQAGHSVPDGELAPAPHVATADHSSPYLLNCNMGATEDGLKSCTWGDKTSEITVAVVGASHDAQWIESISNLGELSGFRVISMTKNACPFGDVAAAGFDADPSCLDWNYAVLQRLLDEPPSLVFTMATMTTTSGDEESAWKLPYLERLSEAAIKVLGVRDNPRFENRVPDCVEAKGLDACGKPTSEALPPPETLQVPQLPHFTFLDITSEYCPDDHCPAAQDGLLIYRDNDHLTTTWTLLRGGTIHNAIRDLLGLDADPESVA